MAQDDIEVRGSGVVGLVAALALARQGFRVRLQGSGAADGVQASSSEVRAYALNPASVRLLSELKVWEALPADARTPVYDMLIHGDERGSSPGAMLEFSAWSQGVGELAWIVDASWLEQALQAAARFAPHIRHVDAGQHNTPVALQVLAEGKASATRKDLGVQWQRHPYGHQGVAARLLSERPHAGQARQWFRSPDVLALLPLDRPQHGHGYGLVWSLPQGRAEAMMALGGEAFEQALMQATGGAAGHLRLASPRAQWPLAVAQADRVYGPGWVLVGDAAHVVHPLAGQGLNLGLADVAALAQVLAGRETWRGLGDPRLLARYAQQRWAATKAMVHLTDGLLRLFSEPSPLLHLLRNRGMRLVDQAGPLKRLLVAQALGG